MQLSYRTEYYDTMLAGTKNSIERFNNRLNTNEDKSNGSRTCQ